MESKSVQIGVWFNYLTSTRLILKILKMYSFKDILKLSFNIITLIIKMEMLQIFDWLEIL